MNFTYQIDVRLSLIAITRLSGMKNPFNLLNYEQTLADISSFKKIDYVTVSLMPHNKTLNTLIFT